MADIIKTIESWRDPERVLRWLTARNHRPDDYRYYFSIGRGRRKQPVERLFFTF